MNEKKPKQEEIDRLVGESPTVAREQDAPPGYDGAIDIGADVSGHALETLHDDPDDEASRADEKPASPRDPPGSGDALRR